MARYFNGSGATNYLGCTADGVLEITGDISISCWFKSVAAVVSTVGLVAKWNGSSGNSCYALYVDNRNLLAGLFRNGVGTQQSITGARQWKVGQWHHAAVVHDAAADENRLYLDGWLDALATGATADPQSANLAALEIGNIAIALPFKGYIDDVAIWSAPLRGPEIRSLYHGVSPLRIRRAALADYWRLDHNENSEKSLTGAHAITQQHTQDAVLSTPRPPIFRRASLLTAVLSGASFPRPASSVTVKPAA